MDKCKNKQNIPSNVEFMILCVELIIRPILSDTCAEFLEEKVEIIWEDEVALVTVLEIDPCSA